MRRMRNYWSPRIVLCTVILAAISSIFLGYFSSVRTGIFGLVVTLLALGAAYGVRCLMRTSLTRVRLFYMAAGFVVLWFVSWAFLVMVLTRVFGLGSDYASLISEPFAVLGGLPGIWLGNLLGKRASLLLESEIPEDGHPL